MAFDTTIPMQECTEAFTRSILDNISGPHFLLDRDMNIVALNGEAGRLFALHQADAEGQPFSRLFVSLREQDAARRSCKRQSWQAEACSFCGSRFPAEFTCSLIESTQGRRYLVTVRDLTEQRHFEDELFAQKALSQVTLDAVTDAILTTDKAGIITFGNRAARLLLGRSEQDLLGNRLINTLRFHDTHHNQQLEAAVSRVLHSGDSFHLNESAELTCRDGDTLCIAGKLAVLRNRAGEITGCTAVVRDLSTERRMQAVLSFKASHDELTGLINRREFEHRLHEQVLRGGSLDEPSSVLMIDIDRFKLINDSHGHIAGDLLLRHLTGVLLEQIRISDTLARIGGDEFAVLLPGYDSKRAQRLAESLRGIVSAFRFAWQDEQITIGVSIGVVTVDSQMFRTADVVCAADAALLMAKERGRDRVVVYQPEGLEEQRRRGEVRWASRIRQALDVNRFRLYCQPIVPLDRKTNLGWSCEVLVRMLDSHGELVPPMAFIPAAERYDLMPLVDRWVIRSVTELWQSEPDIFGQIEKCNINISGQSLAQDGFLEFVLGQFEQTGFPYQMACLEITETAVVANMQNAQQLIRELSARGCLFALDDFGSGLSSFTYLKHLPVNYLKIDGAFVRDMLNEPMDAAMVKAIADIGHTLGLQSIAEFVENDAIITELRNAGVDYAQGYGVQKPFPLSELINYRPSP